MKADDARRQVEALQIDRGMIYKCLQLVDESIRANSQLAALLSEREANIDKHGEGQDG